MSDHEVPMNAYKATIDERGFVFECENPAYLIHLISLKLIKCGENHQKWEKHWQEISTKQVEMISKLNSEIDDLRRQLESANDALIIATEDPVERKLRDRIAEFEQQINDLNREHSEESASLHETIAKHTLSIEKQYSRIVELEDTLHRVLNGKDALQKQIEENDAEIRRLSERLADYNEHNHSLRNRLNQSQAEVASLKKAELSPDVVQEIANYKARINALEIEIETLKSQHAEEYRNIAGANKRLLDANKELSASNFGLQEECRKWKEAHRRERSDKEGYFRDLGVQQAVNSSLRENLEGVEKSLEIARSERDYYKQRVAELETDNTRKTKQVEQLQESALRSARYIAQIEQERDNWKKISFDMERERNEALNGTQSEAQEGVSSDEMGHQQVS